MKLRIALYSVFGCLLFALLMGTFFDLSISQTLVSDPNNYFLHAVSGFGLVIPYITFALVGGLLVRITLDNKEQKTWLKVLLIIFGIAISLAGVYFAAHDNFTVNGLNKDGVLFDFLGYGNAVLLCGFTFFLGYIGGKDNMNKKLWIAILVISFSIIISQVFGTVILKSLFHRPRFRSLGGELEFQPWYMPYGDYEKHITDVITKEEFKSFPSGHASVSALMMFYAIVIPPLFPKYLAKKLSMPLFFVGLAYFIFVALVRILAGAHFLSDVSFGGLLTIALSIIAITIIDKYKLLEN